MITKGESIFKKCLECNTYSLSCMNQIGFFQQYGTQNGSNFLTHLKSLDCSFYLLTVHSINSSKSFFELLIE